MDAQQLHDHIIKPTLEYMGGNYDSKNARMLLLATAAIESNCGYSLVQKGGPALGPWQMEPETHDDIWDNCDALRSDHFSQSIDKLSDDIVWSHDYQFLINCLTYACAMARLKYSMDKEALPSHNEPYEIYRYYKRVYNTHLGASTWEKFQAAWSECGLDKVVL